MVGLAYLGEVSFPLVLGTHHRTALHHLTHQSGNTLVGEVSTLRNGLDDFGGPEGDALGDLGEPGADGDGAIDGATDETDLGNMPLQEDSIKTEDVLLSESLSLNKKINDIVKDLDDTISKKE